MSFQLELEQNNQTCCKDHPFSDHLILWLYNESLFTNVNLPSVIYLSILVVLGIFGNSIILYIYGSKFKTTNAHFFILSLAGLDMVCCVSMILEIFDKRFPVYSGNYKMLCKITRLAEMFSSVSSSSLLLCIALDRYNKICKPFKQFTHKRARKCLVCCIILGVLLSWPMVLFHGPEKVHSGVQNVTGSECGDDENYKNSILPSVYFGLLGVLNILAIIILSFFYVRIFRAVLVWKRKQRGEKIPESPGLSSVSMNYNAITSLSTTSNSRQKLSYSNSDSNYYTKSLNGSMRCGKKAVGQTKESSICEGIGNLGYTGDYDTVLYSEQKSTQNMLIDSSVTGRTSGGNPTDTDVSGTGKSPLRERGRYSVYVGSGRKHMSRKSFKHYKTVTTNTLLFSVVTVIYILSYLPTIIIETLNAAHVYDDESLPYRTRSVLVIMNLTYFFNSIANQYVYSAINPAFRRHVKQLFCGP